MQIHKFPIQITLQFWFEKYPKRKKNIAEKQIWKFGAMLHDIKVCVYVFQIICLHFCENVWSQFCQLFFYILISFFFFSFLTIGSLEELDQELGLDDTNHGNAAKVKDLVEKLKSQTEKDRRKRQQRIEKKGKAYLYVGLEINKSFYFPFWREKK